MIGDSEAGALQLRDLYGWSSEKERQKPQNDDVVCPLPRGAKTPKICALCVLCGWSLHPTVHVAILRGHGTRDQDLWGVTSRAWYVDADRTLLKLWESVDRVVVVGLSMGSLVALELAMRHPGKTVRLECHQMATGQRLWNDSQPGLQACRPPL
jgi:pimeloyl-ACP methyl ester carboxylesterase